MKIDLKGKKCNLNEAPPTSMMGALDETAILTYPFFILRYSKLYKRYTYGACTRFILSKLKLYIVWNKEATFWIQRPLL